MNEAKCPSRLERCSIVESVPQEIWKEIFSLFCQDIENSQQQLQILSCVSPTWSNLVDELVQVRYKDCADSDWLLSHQQHLTALKVRFGGFSISD